VAVVIEIYIIMIPRLLTIEKDRSLPSQAFKSS
jgi:hypothetical protein